MNHWKKLHGWDLTPAKARAIQGELSKKIIRRDCFSSITRVAGVDVGFNRQNGLGRAAISVLDINDLQEVDCSVAEIPLTYPYIPGLLSFREIPAILLALEMLSELPDLLLCDGQGVAHPRRFGIACHLGLITDIPAVGVGKTRLTGEFGDVPNSRGAWAELTDKGKVIGAVLRSRPSVKPIFVSPGHKISLVSAVHYVMQCVTRYRLPETTRRAHALSLFQT